MGQKQKKSKVFSEIFRAVMQIIGAMIVLLLFLVMAFAQFFTSLGVSSSFTTAWWLSRSSPAAWLLAGALLAGMLLFSAIKTLGLASRFHKVAKELAKGCGSALPLEQLAGAVHCPAEKLNHDIQVMIGRSYFSPPVQLDLYREELVAGNVIVLPPEDASEYKEVRKKPLSSLVPAAVFVFIYLILFGAGQLTNVVLAVVVAAVAAVYCSYRTVPIRSLVQVKGKQRQQPVRTGDKATDDILAEARESMATLERLSKSISAPRMGDSLKAMVSAGGDIVSHIEGHPEKLRQVKQFLNYYLPTTIKLLETYHEFSAQSVRGDNIRNSMEKIEGMMQEIATAFRRELDNLYFDRAVDISADIHVMQSMLRQEGISQGEILNVEFGKEPGK